MTHLVATSDEVVRSVRESPDDWGARLDPDDLVPNDFEIPSIEVAVNVIELCWPQASSFDVTSVSALTPAPV